MENLITQVTRSDADNQAVKQQQLQPTWADPMAVGVVLPPRPDTDILRLERLSLTNNSTNSSPTVGTNVTVSDAVNPITSVTVVTTHNNNNDSNNVASPPSATGTFPNGGGNGVLVRKPRPARRFFKSLLCCWRISPPNRPSRTRRPETGGSGGSGRAGDDTELGRNGCSEYYPAPILEKLLLPPMRPSDLGKTCLIVDLDETLVHSSFKPVKNPDFIIPVEIDGVIHQVYVLKRPFVDEFLQRIGNIFECVLFTASLAKYADPVADLLDKWGVFRSRLFREACVFHKGNYVKDLNRLGRDLKRVVIVDNSPASYSFHPDNAIPVQSWFDDMNDSELLDLVPFLERLAKVENVYSLLRSCNEPSPPLEM